MNTVDTTKMLEDMDWVRRLLSFFNISLSGFTSRYNWSAVKSVNGVQRGISSGYHDSGYLAVYLIELRRYRTLYGKLSSEEVKQADILIEMNKQDD